MTETKLKRRVLSELKNKFGLSVFSVEYGRGGSRGFPDSFVTGYISDQVHIEFLIEFKVASDPLLVDRPETLMRVSQVAACRELTKSGSVVFVVCGHKVYNDGTMKVWRFQPSGMEPDTCVAISSKGKLLQGALKFMIASTECLLRR